MDIAHVLLLPLKIRRSGNFQMRLLSESDWVIYPFSPLSCLNQLRMLRSCSGVRLATADFTVFPLGAIPNCSFFPVICLFPLCDAILYTRE